MKIDLTVKGCNFSNNNAAFGGALAISLIFVLVKFPYFFENNKIVQSKGVLVQIIDSIFMNNTNDDINVDYLSQGVVQITNCFFKNKLLNVGSIIAWYVK